MALFSPPVLAPETRPPLGIHGTTYRPLGHQTFVLWHALIITMPWCPSWARRKTFPLRTSGITFLESQKTILPHTHTHSSSLTHKHAGVLQRDQSLLRTCCRWLVIFGSLSETNSTYLDVRKTGMHSRTVIVKKSIATLLVFGSNLIESSASAIFAFPDR